MNGRTDAVVVGGGVAGLVLADALADAGRRVVVLERSGRPGGLVMAGRLRAPSGTAAELGGDLGVELGGDLGIEIGVDLGAEAFATAGGEVARLAEGLGLTVVGPSGAPAHLARADGTVALPPSLLGIPIDAAGVAQLLGAEAAREALALDARPLGATPTTLGALVRERLGARIAEGVVAPVVAAVHATPADEAELASIAPRLAPALTETGSLIAAAARLRGDGGASGAAVATVLGGMTALVDALVGRIRARDGLVLVERTVTDVAREPDGWTVRSEGADGTSRAIAAPIVGLALPAAAARPILGSGPREMPDALAGLAAFGASSVAIVALLVRDDRLAGAPLGTGVLVTDERPDVAAKALTHTSAKWPHVRTLVPEGLELVRLSYGGTRAVPDGDDATLVRHAAEDLGRLLGGGAVVVLDGTVARWADALPRPTSGRAAAVRTLRSTAAATPGLAIVGTSVAGNGLAGVVAQALAEASRLLAGRTATSEAGS